ncbi:MAG: dipeptidase [Phycisphaerales bacterium JB043]
MRVLSALATLSVALTSTGSLAQDVDYERTARDILSRMPIIDGHNDVPWTYRARVQNRLGQIDFSLSTAHFERPMHTDIPRLREGMVGGQFWSVYIPAHEMGSEPGDTRDLLEQIDVVHRLVSLYPDDLQLALTADDVENAIMDGKIASLIGIEGGHAIEKSLAVLRMSYALGARYMTLTHSLNIEWADSATDDRVLGGLSPFGEEVVREMNRMGMLVDLSHVSAETMHDTLDIAEAPVIFSHSSAYALSNSPRNVPDDVLVRVRDNGGVVMVTFVPTYLNEKLRQWSVARRDAYRAIAEEHGDDEDAVNAAREAWMANNPRRNAAIADAADHIEHIIKVAGIDHVGIGGDYDGVSSLPDGLEDVSTYPALFAELLRRGLTGSDLEKISGRNILRVMRETERVAARLQNERPASDALYTELDAELIADTNSESD